MSEGMAVSIKLSSLSPRIAIELSNTHKFT